MVCEVLSVVLVLASTAAVIPTHEMTTAMSEALITELDMISTHDLMSEALIPTHEMTTTMSVIDYMYMMVAISIAISFVL